MTPDRGVSGGRHMQIRSLQVLRFFAALLVVIGHAQHELREVGGASVPRLLSFVPFDWGLGVDIFFVISGFVMMFVTQGQFGKPGASALFLRRRIIRIAPMYWLFSTPVVLAAVSAASRGGEAVYWLNVVFSYLFLPGPRCDAYCYPIFSLGWTLNYEMLFYGIFAIALLLRERTGILLIGGIIVALVIVGRFVPAEWTMARFWGTPIIGEFLIGVGLALLYRTGFRIPRPAGWALVVLGAVAAVLFYQTGSYEHIWRLVTGGVPAALILSGVMFALLAERRSAGTIALSAGGDASYALYLCHPFAIKGVSMIATRLGFLETLTPWFIPVAVVIALVASLLLHRWLERPLVDWLNRSGRASANKKSVDPRPADGCAGLALAPGATTNARLGNSTEL